MKNTNPMAEEAEDTPVPTAVVVAEEADTEALPLQIRLRVRIRKKLELSESMTSAETGKYVLETFGTDMSATVEDHDAVVYGGKKVGEGSRAAALEVYNRLTELMKEQKKSAKRRVKK